MSKRCNRLQADIVEALQFLKCVFHSDLIFHEVCTVKEEEVLLDHDRNTGMSKNTSSREASWEELVLIDDIVERA